MGNAHAPSETLSERAEHPRRPPRRSAPVVDDVAKQVGVKAACALLGRPRGSHYRAKTPRKARVPGPRSAPPNALTGPERDRVLEGLTGSRFCDKSVGQTWATMLDEVTCLGSMSTMHRILRVSGATGERRAQPTRPAREKPELVATRPWQVRRGDIERHEALLNRAVVKGHRLRSVVAFLVVAWHRVHVRTGLPIKQMALVSVRHTGQGY